MLYIYLCKKYILYLCVIGDVDEIETPEKNTLRVFNNITLVYDSNMVMLEVRPFLAVSFDVLV